MTRAAWDTGVGRHAVKSGWVAVLSVLIAAFALLLLYSVMAFWPPAPTADGPSAPAFTTQFFGWRPTMSRDQGLLLIVALAGGLGATGAVLRSFSRYVGERHLVWSWVPSYLLTPLIGSLFATITYILLRAGLISGGQATQGNPFGFVAVAALVGLFSTQAATKLKEIFETIFAKAEPGAEAIATAGGPPTIDGFDPDSGGEGVRLKITGTGLEKVTAVGFGGGVSAPPMFDPVTGTLHVSVPQGAQHGPLSVSAGSKTSTSEQPFKVTK